MAERLPLVHLGGGQVGELPSGDTIPGGKRSVQVFTSSSWYAKPVGLKYVRVTVVGGGGGGGGAGATTASQRSAGKGGAAGGAAIKMIAADDLGDTEIVTVGAGGSGGAGNNSGTNGGT